MELKFDWKYWFAFLALNGVVSELHEQAHITTGRLLTGCYGPRDFNVWQACADHAAVPAWAPSLAGPLWSYALMWLGVWLLVRGASVPQRALGLALVFAPFPFARIFTAVMGGGDERMFLGSMTGGALAPALLHGLAIGLTLLVCGVPIWQAWRALRMPKRGLWIAALCVLPMLAVYVYKLKLLNTLLQHGLWDSPPLLGTPPLVLATWGVCLIASAFTWRWLLPPAFRSAR